MGKDRLNFSDIEKIDLIGILVVGILILLYVDYFDLNEKFRFPISILDEPLLICIGIILGYILGKFRVKRSLKKFFG